MRETKVEHYFLCYSHWVRGYGSSMDPHICGDTEEPCIKATYEREVSPWILKGKEVIHSGDVSQDSDVVQEASGRPEEGQDDSGTVDNP